MSAPELAAVTDRLAITDLLHRYCRAVDRLDHELGYSVWHPDGEADYGATFQGTGHGFIDFVIEQHRQCLTTSHHVTNIALELDGARAASEAYHFAAIRIEREGRPHLINVWGRYIDTWSKRDGRWGIDRRVTVRDFSDMREIAPLDGDPRSRRDRDDPSYAVLRG